MRTGDGVVGNLLKAFTEVGREGGREERKEEGKEGGREGELEEGSS